jgi:hypothetical protein
VEKRRGVNKLGFVDHVIVPENFGYKSRSR